MIQRRGWLDPRSSRQLPQLSVFARRVRNIQCQLTRLRRTTPHRLAVATLILIGN